MSVTQGELMGTIVVKDTGIVSLTKRRRTSFSRFWRADAGRTRESVVWASSFGREGDCPIATADGCAREGSPNEGARFTIYIPLYNRTMQMRKKTKRLGN